MVGRVECRVAISEDLVSKVSPVKLTRQSTLLGQVESNQSCTVAILNSLFSMKVYIVNDFIVLVESFHLVPMVFSVYIVMELLVGINVLLLRASLETKTPAST